MERSLILILILTLFLAFFKLGKQPIETYDEARHAVIAIEMLEKQDWLNYYYVGVQDTWFAKPPLGIWSIAGSMKLFGYNLFSLRFPSAIATLFILFFTYKLIRLFEDENFALTCCLIILSVKGIVGWHAGRTGDLDAMLIAFLMAGVYYFVKFIQTKNNVNIYFCATALGLAFWTKGPAMVLFFPGMLLFLLISKKLSEFFKNKNTWIAALLMAAFPIVYLLLMAQFGNQFEQTKYAGDNTVEAMFLYDLVERFTNPDFENEVKNHSWDYFPVFLDVRFNLWNYIFYFATILFLFSKFIPQKWRPTALADSPLLILSCGIWFSLGLILSILSGQKIWYLCPIIPFLAITVWYGIKNLTVHFPIIKYLIGAIIIFTLGRQVYQQNHLDETLKIVRTIDQYSNRINSIHLPQTNIDQAIMAHCYFLQKPKVFENEVDFERPLEKGEILLLPTRKSKHDRIMLRRLNQSRIVDDFELFYSKMDDFSM